MRFVHVEDFLHPNAGYQVNLLSKLQAQQGHEVIIVCAEMEKIPDYLTSFFGKEDIEKKDREFEENTGVKILRYPLYGFYSGRAIFKPGLHKFIKSLNPDVLFVHNDDTVKGMSLIWDYKRMNLPYVLDSHMLEMASKNKFSAYFRLFFRKFVTPHILKYEIPYVRVVDSDFVEKHYGIPLEKTTLLSFGTDTEFYCPNPQVKQSFRKELNLKEEDFVVIYAGKLDASKGGEFLATALKNKIELEKKNIKFIIIGTTPKDAYGEAVEQLFLESENEIIRFPTQTYFDLAKFYQSADLALFPRQCSLSYFEVQSCGLPVLLEKNEINLERAADQKGMIFSEGNVDEFRKGIEKFGNMDEKTFDLYKHNARKNVVENFNFVPIAQKYTALMIDSYNRFHKKRVSENDFQGR